MAANSPDRANHLKDYRFPKGFSGNPTGRPKRKPIEEQLLRLIDGKAGPRDKRSHARKVAEAILKQAGRGNVKAFVAVAERTDGKVPQPVALTSADGGKLVIEIRDIGGGK